MHDGMTPEERYERMERKIEFILDQQGQFYADLRKHDEQLEKLKEQTTQNAVQIGTLTAHVAENTRQIGQLAHVVGELTLRIDSLGQSVKELTEAGKHTDDRLNIVINTVERYFSDRNGSQN